MKVKRINNNNVSVLVLFFNSIKLLCYMQLQLTMIFDDQGNQKPNELFVNRYLYAAYLKGKKTTRKSTCCTCCSWWCCKGGRGCAEVFCLQTDCIASCLQTCASCCPTRIPDITNFGVAQFSHKHPYVQRWYNVLQFTKGNMQ